MAKYRAIVSIEFDTEDLNGLAERLEVSPERMDALEAVRSELDSFSFGIPHVEQLLIDGEPHIIRLTSGIMVEISE